MKRLVKSIKSATFYLFMLLIYVTLLALAANGEEKYRATDIIPVSAEKNLLETFEALPYEAKNEAKQKRNFEGIRFFSPGTLFERVGNGSIWDSYWLVKPVGYGGEYWAPEESLANALIIDNNGNYRSYNHNAKGNNRIEEIEEINRQIYLLELRLEELKED